MDTQIHIYIIAPQKCLFIGDIGWFCFGAVLTSLYLSVEKTQIRSAKR